MENLEKSVRMKGMPGQIGKGKMAVSARGYDEEEFSLLAKKRVGL